MRRALTSEMEKDGCTDIVWDGNKVTFEDADGYSVTSTVDFTQSYILKVDGDSKYVKVGTEKPVLKGDLTGSWYTTDGGKTFAKVDDVKTDIDKMPAKDLTIESGYTQVDLKTTFLSGANTDNLEFALTLDGKAVTSGSATDVYYVKGADKELVATVTGSVKVAQSGTGILKGSAGAVSKVANPGTPDNNGTPPVEDSTTNVNFVASVDSGTTTYTGFELTFTWTVTQGTDLSAVTLTGTDFAS